MKKYYKLEEYAIVLDNNRGMWFRLAIYVGVFFKKGIKAFVCREQGRPCSIKKIW